MKNKGWSLIIVLAIYVIAAAGGAAVVCFAPIGSKLLLLFAADIAGTLVVFLFSLVFRNASVYDPYWSVAPPLLVAGFYLTSGAVFPALHLLFLIPLCFWAVRLTYNWVRSFENLEWQDWRYVNYKQQFPRIYPLINLTGIMLMPTILVFAGTLPLYYLITGTANIIAVVIGGAVILFAAVYQTVADFQLRRVKRNPDNKGKCIDEGLWRLSRHPNYFGEVAIWFGVFITSLPNFSWPTPIGCVAILCLFVFVSVPMMEKKMLKNKPQYKEYKQTVPSILVPFCRRK